MGLLRDAFADPDVIGVAASGAGAEVLWDCGLEVGLDVSGTVIHLLIDRLLSGVTLSRRVKGLYLRAALSLWDGAWPAGEIALDEIDELCNATASTNLFGDHIRLAILARRGQVDQFEVSYARAQRATTQAGMEFWTDSQPGDRGWLMLTLGDLAAAEALFAGPLARPPWDHLAPNTDLVGFAVARLEALLDLGRRQEAVAAHDQLVAMLPADTTLGRGILARAAADLAGGDDADALFQAAERDIERGVEVFMLAGTRLRHARWLRRRRRRREAAEQLRPALEAFESMGCAPWAAQCRVELAAVGADVARHERYDPAATLTAQERRVAEAAAEGLSNKEIARRLFLSPRTVEIHLTHAYRKLDVTGRTALVRALDPATSPTAR